MSEHEAKYIETGSGCPFCGPDGNAEGNPVTIGTSGYAYQECACTECEREWTDVYKLMYVNPTETG